jgi:hypothetical protein
MTRAAYIGVENLARNVKNIYVGVNDTARSVVKGYVGDEDGIAKQFWPPLKDSGSFYKPYEPPVYPPVGPKQDDIVCEHCDENCHGWILVRDWRDRWLVTSGSTAYPGAFGDPPAYHTRWYNIKFCRRTGRILGYIEYGSVTYPGGELPDYGWEQPYQGAENCNDTKHPVSFIPGVWWWYIRRGEDGFWYVPDSLVDNNTFNNSNSTSTMYDPDTHTEADDAAMLQNAQLNNPISDVDLEEV